MSSAPRRNSQIQYLHLLVALYQTGLIKNMIELRLYVQFLSIYVNDDAI